MLKLLTSGCLLSLHWGFSGDTPELAMAHALAWQAPKYYYSLDILSISGGIGAVNVAHNVSDCR